MKKQPKENIKAMDELIAQRLKNSRQTLGIALKDVANAAGVSIQQVMKYESCANRIPLSRLYFVAKMMDMPIKYFVSNATNNVH